MKKPVWRRNPLWRHEFDLVSSCECLLRLLDYYKTRKNPYLLDMASRGSLLYFEDELGYSADNYDRISL